MPSPQTVIINAIVMFDVARMLCTNVKARLWVRCCHRTFCRALFISGIAQASHIVSTERAVHSVGSVIGTVGNGEKMGTAYGPAGRCIIQPDLTPFWKGRGKELPQRSNTVNCICLTSNGSEQIRGE